MTMQARMLVEAPDKVNVTMKITMPVADWCRLRDELSRAYPAWKLSSALTEMLSRVRKVFHSEEVDAFDAEYIP